MRKEIKTILAERGLDNKFSIRRVGFFDLARTECIEVTIKGWNPKEGEAEKLKRAIKQRFPQVIVTFNGSGIVYFG